MNTLAPYIQHMEAITAYPNSSGFRGNEWLSGLRSGEMDEDKKNPVVYRISTEAEWQLLQQTGASLGGDLDKQTGCIHLSDRTQVKSVLHNFFPGREDLYLLKVDTGRLGEGLVYESADGQNFFPHFYGPSGSFGPLTLGTIIEANKLELVDGDFVLPF